MARGKNQDARYVGIAAQIPKELRRQLRVKLAMLELDANTTLEILVRRFVSGETVITSKDLETIGLQNIPEAIPQDMPQPSPVSPKPSTPKTPKPSPPTEATQLATLLEQLGISQNELARRLGISSQSMSRYVSGKRRTPPEVLQAAKDMLEPTEGE